MGAPDPAAPHTTTDPAPYVHDPDSSTGKVLAAIYALQDAEAQFRSRLRTILGLRPSELGAVQFIARRETIGSPAHPTDIARHLGLTTGAASIILNHLAEQGFITRHLNPADGRGQIIRLTETVQDAMRQAAGGGELGALGQILTLSDRESRRVVTLLSNVTSGYADGARDGLGADPV